MRSMNMADRTGRVTCPVLGVLLIRWFVLVWRRLCCRISGLACIVAASAVIFWWICAPRGIAMRFAEALARGDLQTTARMMAGGSMRRRVLDWVRAGRFKDMHPERLKLLDRMASDVFSGREYFKVPYATLVVFVVRWPRVYAEFDQAPLWPYPFTEETARLYMRRRPVRDDGFNTIDITSELMPLGDEEVPSVFAPLLREPPMRGVAPDPAELSVQERGDVW